jgi:hypothetical protein
VPRELWQNCVNKEVPCYSKASAVIIDDHDYACKGQPQKTNCFRPSYTLSDLT